MLKWQVNIEKNIKQMPIATTMSGAGRNLTTLDLFT